MPRRGPGAVAAPAPDIIRDLAALVGRHRGLDGRALPAAVAAWGRERGADVPQDVARVVARIQWRWQAVGFRRGVRAAGRGYSSAGRS